MLFFSGFCEAFICYLWHTRVSLIFLRIHRIGLHNVSKFFPFISYKHNDVPCDSCHIGKQRKLPFPNSVTHSNAPFKILHVDIWGPFSIISVLGHKYFLTLVDDYSRYTWVTFLKTKGQAKNSIIQFVAYIENQFNTSLKCLRSDNGSEFLALSNFLLSKGVIHQRSCVETPQ